MFAAANVEKVIRHLVRFGSTPAEAEDLAQEALLIAWRKQADLEQDRPLDAWLFGIARNVYRNHARSVRRHPIASADADDRAGEGVAPARSLADVLAVRAALQALPENQQDIVILHELEEYTLKETAELLAIPFETAKDRLRRAREALRHTMADDLATRSEAERRDARRIAKLAVASVLAGFVGVLASSGSAAAAAGVGVGSVGAAAPVAA
ncbi:MAG: sigma-70 family RNA polymerase sigma factor, partial [Myxococcota bacterium]|nr:sigma-70 family RNA polymerase sigma factor [Myxococcota bacterium]